MVEFYWIARHAISPRLNDHDHLPNSKLRFLLTPHLDGSWLVGKDLVLA
jgi:hypothetical protein